MSRWMTWVPFDSAKFVEALGSERDLEAVQAALRFSALPSDGEEKAAEGIRGIFSREEGGPPGTLLDVVRDAAERQGSFIGRRLAQFLKLVSLRHGRLVDRAGHDVGYLLHGELEAALTLLPELEFDDPSDESSRRELVSLFERARARGAGLYFMTV